MHKLWTDELLLLLLLPRTVWLASAGPCWDFCLFVFKSTDHIDRGR